jgi:hypothetical protein
MKVRRFVAEQDYPLVKTWWEKRGLPAVPPQIISENCALVEKDSKPIVVGWVYFDDMGKIGIVEGITTDPDIEWNEELGKAVDMLIDFFRFLAKWKKVRNLVSFVEDHSGLHRRMVRTGWQDPKSKPHVYLFQGI